MDAMLKKKWIAALRSGEYMQGRNYLCLDTSEGRQYCCLGVLCIVAKLEPVLTTKIAMGEPLTATVVAFDGATKTLPDKFRVEQDLSSSTMLTLASFNDAFGDRRKSFPEIADWIEERIT